MSSAFQLLARCVLSDPAAPRSLFEVIARLPVSGNCPDPDEVQQSVAVTVLTDAPALFRRLLDRDPALREQAGDAAAVAAMSPERLRVADRRLHGYLRQMILNTERNLWRAGRRRREVPDAHLEHRADPGEDPAEAHAAQELAEAYGRLLAELPEATRGHLADMVALLEGHLTFETLVDREVGAPSAAAADPEVRTKARDRIYKRHRDARGWIEQQIRQLARLGAVDEAHGDVLIRRISSLRRRIPRSGSVRGSGRSS